MHLLIILGSLGTFVVALTIHSILTAPIGYEDATGFHPEVFGPGASDDLEHERRAIEHAIGG